MIRKPVNILGSLHSRAHIDVGIVLFISFHAPASGGVIICCCLHKLDSSRWAGRARRFPAGSLHVRLQAQMGVARAESPSTIDVIYPIPSDVAPRQKPGANPHTNFVFVGLNQGHRFQKH